MAIYHCSAKIISRSSGRSSVAAAAYRAGEYIRNERDGISHDYTRKRGVEYSEIMLPDNAPQEYRDRAILWNAVEKAEKRKDAQTAREFDVALPAELNREGQIELLQEYTRDNFVSRGMIADICIHDKGDGNPHAHIMLTTRAVTPDGFGGKERAWNDKGLLNDWREQWAAVCNRGFERNNLPERIDHRSLAAQGIDREPTIHIGTTAHQMEKRGKESDRGRINGDVRERNAGYQKALAELEKTIANLMREKERDPQREQSAPERLERPSEARESKERGTAPASPQRAKLRGAVASLRGVPLPLDRRAAIELRKYQAADIQAMAGALLTMRREGIERYSDLDRRIGEYRRERDALNGRMDSITKEIDGIAGTLGAMEIYNTHLQYREAVEKAGVFRKKKVGQKYRLELQALAGSEQELQRLGIDPASVTPETPERQRGRIEELRREKMGLRDQRDELVDRRVALMKSKEQMDRLFLFKNIDRENFRSRYMEMDIGSKDSAVQDFLREHQRKADLYNSQLPDRDPSRSRGLDR